MLIHAVEYLINIVARSIEIIEVSSVKTLRE